MPVSVALFVVAIFNRYPWMKQHNQAIGIEICIWIPCSYAECESEIQGLFASNIRKSLQISDCVCDFLLLLFCTFVCCCFPAGLVWTSLRINIIYVFAHQLIFDRNSIHFYILPKDGGKRQKNKSRGRFGKQHPTPWCIMFYNPSDSYTYTPVHN